MRRAVLGRADAEGDPLAAGLARELDLRREQDRPLEGDVDDERVREAGFELGDASAPWSTSRGRSGVGSRTPSRSGRRGGSGCGRRRRPRSGGRGRRAGATRPRWASSASPSADGPSSAFAAPLSPDFPRRRLVARPSQTSSPPTRASVTSVNVWPFGCGSSLVERDAEREPLRDIDRAALDDQVADVDHADRGEREARIGEQLHVEGEREHVRVGRRQRLADA